MAIIDKLWLATRTRDKEDAGTNAKRLNLTVNVDGEDLLDTHFPFMRASGGNLGPDSGWLSRAQAAISESNPLISNLAFLRTLLSVWASGPTMPGLRRLFFSWATHPLLWAPPQSTKSQH